MAFKKNVKESFKRSRDDVDSFKSTMHSWILEFQKENRLLKEELKSLRERLEFLEKSQVEKL